MLGKTKTIIAINKEKVIGAKVSIRGSKKIKKTIELGWDEETLDVALEKIVSKFKAKKVRILLNDKLSYVLRLKVPFNLSESEKRKVISDKISAQIPEALDEDDWDYKELKFGLTLDNQATEKEHEVIVFSPVKHFFKILSKAIDSLNLDVEAIEPEAIAKTRNTNPLVGLAMKKDIEGKDKDVLNLEPLDVSQVPEDIEELKNDELLIDEAKRLQEASENLHPQQATLDSRKTSEEEGRQPTKSRFPMVAFLVFVLASVLVFVYFYFSKNREKVELSPIEQETVVEESEEVDESEEEKSAVVIGEKDISEYKLQVVNGSGIAGEASVVSEILEEEGFENIKTANADSYDHKDTEVELKTDVTEEIYETLVRALNSEYAMKKMETSLSDNSEYDMVITVGQRVVSEDD